MKHILLFIVLTFFSHNVLGQDWNYDGNFPNDNFKGGTGLQGLAVDPDGKVWVTKYSAEYFTFPGTTDSLPVRLIYVFNSDGSPALFSPIWRLFGPGFADTLVGSNSRGLRSDQNGNIICVFGDQSMYRINYQTGAGMNKVGLGLGTSPTAPGVSENGHVFIGPVINEAHSMKEFDSDFNLIGNAVTFTQLDFTRSIEVDLDWGNNKVYFPSALDRKLIIVYQRPDEFSTFDSVGTIMDGVSCESITFNKVSRKLWAAGGSYSVLPATTSPYSPNVWYEYDLLNNIVTDSIKWQMNFPNNMDERPRAIDFSPDGNTAYIGCFGANDYPMVQKFSKSVLPVELISFNASVENSNVLLNWIVGSELNNAGFDIERKSRCDWEKIGFVIGNGTTTESSAYLFNDKSLPVGEYQYRLKQIDFNGLFEYSETINVNVGLPEKIELLQNYPNPFNPNTTINWKSPKRGWQSLKVFDILGNEVAVLVDEFREAGDYDAVFNASHLSSGIYYYQLKAGNYVQTKKMLLVK